MGAKIIEKHITIDRQMKGTDQAGSLGPDGVNRMIRDIRIAEMWLGKEELFIDPSVTASRVKLERSIASKCALEVGETVTIDKVHMLSPGDGFKWSELNSVIGHKVIRPIPANEIIYKDYID